MSVEDAEALYRKLATKQKLESSWNPFSGAFWAPRKARGIELEEMEERGFVWNKKTRHGVRLGRARSAARRPASC